MYKREEVTLARRTAGPVQEVRDGKGVRQELPRSSGEQD